MIFVPLPMSLLSVLISVLTFHNHTCHRSIPMNRLHICSRDQTLNEETWRSNDSTKPFIINSLSFPAWQWPLNNIVWTQWFDIHLLVCKDVCFLLACSPIHRRSCTRREYSLLPETAAMKLDAASGKHRSRELGRFPQLQMVFCDTKTPLA